MQQLLDKITGTKQGVKWTPAKRLALAKEIREHVGGQYVIRMGRLSQGAVTKWKRNGQRLLGQPVRTVDQTVAEYNLMLDTMWLVNKRYIKVAQQNEVVQTFAANLLAKAKESDDDFSDSGDDTEEEDESDKPGRKKARTQDKKPAKK